MDYGPLNQACGMLGVQPSDVVFRIKCVPKGDYKLRWGGHSEKTLPRGKIFGFKTFDKVRYRGKEYFIRGRMSTGYANLMNIKGEVEKPVLKVSQTLKNGTTVQKTFKTVQLKYCTRISARKSTLISMEV